ncbi:MAG TPA: hypothetical protein GX715_12325 [Armatimonadetes bacterium]|nr:hypothetical protein [Armatimonadota bacterium]
MKALWLAMAALLGASGIAVAGPAPGGGMETQLAGIQLGKSAVTVVQAYGNPRRVQVGTVTAPGQSGGAGGAGMPGMPGGEMGGMPGGAPPMGGPGMPGPEMGGMPGGSPQPAQTHQTIHWIYEREREGVVYVFGFDEEGTVVAITVGDGLEDSVNRGGTRRPFAGARTSRGIKLGDPFREVIRAYGYPETQQNAGDEVVLTYYEKAGVAFSMKQGVMRVTSITIRDMGAH